MLLSALLALVAFASLFVLVTSPSPGPADQTWTVLLLGISVALLAARLLLEEWVMGGLRRGILKAREGLLDPVPTGPRLTSAGSVAAEYNTTIQALQAMFRTVEECQGRFLSQRNRMNTILQSLPGALLSLSDDLQIIMANRQAEEMFSGRGVPLIGTNLFDLLHLNERDREVLRDAFLYKQTIQSQEITLDMGQGPRHYAMNLGFYSDEDNDMAGALILQDISEYRRLQDSIAQREKLVAMGQLAAGVAHELNTPLGSIQGYAQLLERSAGNPEQQSEYAHIILDETKRCSRIVQDLLNYAREDRCTGETCDVIPLVRDLTETFLNCRMKRYNIAIHLDLGPEALIAEGGCGQLDIVLTNLIMNAIHALDGVMDPAITIGAYQEDSAIVVSVADNGPGVKPELRTRIFDPFFTTKDVGQGSGLGLPICQAILAKRGGFILYDQDYAQGARFLVKLPAVDLRRAVRQPDQA